MRMESAEAPRPKVSTFSAINIFRTRGPMHWTRPVDFRPSTSFRLPTIPRRPLFVPGSAEARVAVKAARFRTAFVQLRARWVSFGQLVTAPLFRLGLETGIEAAIGAGSQSKGQYH